MTSFLNLRLESIMLLGVVPIPAPLLLNLSRQSYFDDIGASVLL